MPRTTRRLLGLDGRLGRWILLPLLAAVPFGLTQCRMTGDTVTGVVDTRDAGALHGGGRSSRCQLACDARYRACRHGEDVRYRAALEQCGRIADKADRRACHVGEAKRHGLARAACLADKARCRRDCRYREGSGTGGR